MTKIIEVHEELENSDPNYVELYKRFGYAETTSPWSDIAEKFPSPCRILELGCGCGYISVPLLRLGYEVVGVDANPEMLKVAKEACPNLETITSRIEDLALDKKFNLVILSPLIFNRANDSIRLKIIEKAVAHLDINGFLGIQLLRPSWLNKSQVYDSPNQKVIYESFDDNYLIGSGNIIYYFEDIHYVERFIAQGFDDETLETYLKKWGLIVCKKIIINPIEYICFATLK
jgi:SAM-dependent methyltransferase